MSSFTEPLEMQEISKGLYRTTREFSYYLEDDHSKVITIPNDYTTDGASIPWPCTKLLSRTDPQIAQAAVVHDWLYEHRGFLGWITISRKKMDKIFYNCMKVLGMPWWKRQIVYRVVRAFGWLGYKQHWKSGNKIRVLVPSTRYKVGDIGTIKSVYIWNNVDKYVMVNFEGENLPDSVSILHLERTFD